MLAAQQADPTKPLVNFGYFNSAVTFRGDQDKMWLPLDSAKIPNMNDIYPAYRRPGDMGVGHSVSPIGIAYNTDAVKTPPTSWADVWSILPTRAGSSCSTIFGPTRASYRQRA